MKVAILSGGFGTRILEESYLKPKPMIEIGEKPILWHIMKLYSYYGFNEFIICAGYKQHVIKEWFANYFLHNCDITFDFAEKDKCIVHHQKSEPWKVTIVDTGLNTMTGGRLKRIHEYIGDETFFMTYGDGVSDVNVLETLEFHRDSGKLATMIAVQPESRFGYIEERDNLVFSFQEKSQQSAGWINGGFMVLEPEVLNYIRDDSTTFERDPLETLASKGQLMCYKHEGFWQCMDTLRDKEKLEKLWMQNQAPWKLWTV